MPTQEIPPVPLSFWRLGINSMLAPSEIAKQQYAWGVNILNRGGIPQTRPGRKLRALIEGGKAQGFCYFRPTNSAPCLVAAVDGQIWTMSAPTFTPVLLPGIQMSERVPMVHLCPTVKNTERNTDDSIRIIAPKNVLMISDGVTQTAYWDGVTAAHLNPNAGQTGICTWMAWVGARLWSAIGSKISASDLADPLTHKEGVYLALLDGFYLGGECTGLVPTANREGLLAFTAKTTTAFKAGIRDRTLWATTPEFQDEILQNVGCVAGRTAINQYGITHWLSDKGLVGFDSALQSNQTSRLTTEDEGMMRSRRKMSPNPSGACAATFENFAFFSVPSGNKYNNHTWVMDQAPIGSQSPGGGVWASIWTGIRPVQWAAGRINGRERIFNLCFDESPKDGTKIHVWEEMESIRKDEGGRIISQWITGGIGSTNLLSFKFAQFEATEIYGRVDLKVFVTGTRGPWYQIGEYTLKADEGCFGSESMPLITVDSIIRALKPQARPLRTKEFTSLSKEQTCEHSPYAPGIDRSFQLCFEWTGQMGIQNITVHLGLGPTEGHGSPACLDATQGEAGLINAISETGHQLA